MEILIGGFNAKLGREDSFKPTTGNESLHKISNDNGVRVVNFATSKNLTVKSTMFPHRNIHKYTWTSPDGKTYNLQAEIATAKLNGSFKTICNLSFTHANMTARFDF
jgi:hypothetical protein